MQVKTGIVMKRIQYISVLSASLILAACASQPAVAPGTAAAADGQPFNVNVIDATGLAAYYPFNGSAKDLSSHRNHGTVHGGEFVADRLGNPASAYALNGADAYVSAQGTTNLDTDFELSISVWFYHKTQDSQQEWYSIVEKSDPERWGHSKYGMWLIRDLVEVCVQPVDLKVPHRCVHSENTLEPEQWHHLVGVSDGTTLRVYINGQHAGEEDFGSRTNNSQSQFELYMGVDLYDASPVYVKGIMDELRLYKRALSEAEVTTLYQAK
jgi:hypothetical protein